MVGKFFNWLLYSRTDGAMVARTVGEAVLSYLTTNLPEIFDIFTMEPEVKTLVMGLCMVVLTTILGFVRNKKEEKNACDKV